MKQLEIGSKVPANVIPNVSTTMPIDYFALIGIIILAVILFIVLNTKYNEERNYKISR